MRYLIILALLALAGCDRRAQEAEDSYKILQNENAGPAEKCKQAKRVEALYLESRDPVKYHDWHINAIVDCMHADIEDPSLR